MSLIKPYRHGFQKGFNSYSSTKGKTGIEFDILITDKDEEHEFGEKENEIAIVAIDGVGEIFFDNTVISFNRSNWIDIDPTVIHLSPGEDVKIKSTAQCRFAVIKTNNDLSFKGKVYQPSDIDTEHRGKDQLDDTCYRLVRLAFDDTISPKEAKLVIGEVLNFPGKWSSYPPHHHPQSEIYYYELSPDWGYGHGELGEDVFKIKNGDLLTITKSRTHSQTSAPGFHMYYLWAIRHDDKKRYDGFTYVKSFENMLE